LNSTTVIDTITKSLVIFTSGTTITTINYDFKRYYFLLID